MKNKNTVIFVVRHGETEWNVKKLVQGHKDSPLTENGIKQAKELAKKLKKIKFDLIFSSDLLRAKRTAEIIAAEHNLTVETTELLRERKFGHLQGESVEAFHAFENLFKTLSFEEHFKYKGSPDMESDEELTLRLITFLRETAITYPRKKVLVVTHGGIMRALLLKLGVWDYDNRSWIENGSYIKLESDGVDFFLKKMKGIGETNGKHIY